MPPTEATKAAFQAALLGWFTKFRRKFPWRRRSNPYAILVAEKLLQQTAARDVVVQAYIQFLKKYPTPRHLAGAEILDLEEIIQPLGFIYRAKELQLLGQELVTHHGGKVPRTLKELLALPGVGDYAARAVLSFAYSEDVPIVDTNVARFLYRIYGIEGKMPPNPARKKSLIELAATLVPPGQSKAWNLAVLDLCAAICTPSKPVCTGCPMLVFCVHGNTTTRCKNLP
jgi:A/G-specific adenine glycosylase